MNKQHKALDALEGIHPGNMTPLAEQAWNKAINAIREALAEPEKANQCGETCERAKLCAVCANGLAEPEQVSHHSEDDLDMVKVLDEKTCQKEKQIAWKQCAANIDKFNGNPQFAFSMGFYAGISASQNAKHPPSRPVAYLDLSNDLSYSMRELAEEDVYLDTDTMVPLYTAPPARKPLTDEEIDNLELPPNGCTMRELVRVVERAHGIGD